MNDLEQTHTSHICSNGRQVWFPNEYTSYEEFRKEHLLNLVFERVKLMIRFHEVVTWSIQELLNKIKTLHDNELFLGSNLPNVEYNNLFKDFNKMTIQTHHLKQLIYFLQRSFATYPPSEQMTDIKESLHTLIEIYGAKDDIDLKYLLITTCLDTHKLSCNQLIDILWYFDIDANTIFKEKTHTASMSDCSQKLETIIASYDIDVKNALDDL